MNTRLIKTAVVSLHINRYDENNESWMGYDETVVVESSFTTESFGKIVETIKQYELDKNSGPKTGRDDIKIKSVKEGLDLVRLYEPITDFTPLGYYSQLADLHRRYRGHNDLWPRKHPEPLSNSNKRKTLDLPDNPTIYFSPGPGEKDLPLNVATYLNWSGGDPIGFQVYWEDKDKTFEQFAEEIEQKRRFLQDVEKARMAEKIATAKKIEEKWSSGTSGISGTPGVMPTTCKC